MGERPRDVKSYILKKDPELAAWIDQHVLDEEMLKAPVTFILPDETVRRRITDPANAPETGLSILKAYVIPGISLKSYRHFDPNEKEITTYGDFILEIKHVDTQSGVTVGSATVRKDNEFENNDEYSVYYAQGELPNGGEVSGSRDRRRVRGRGDGVVSKRTKLCNFVEAKYKVYLYKRSKFPKEMRCINPYLEFMVSFFLYLKAKYPNLDALRMILDYDPIASFYILLEPYVVPVGEFKYLISDDIVDEYEFARVYGNIFDQYYALFDKLPYPPGYCESRSDVFTTYQKNIRSLGTEIYKDCTIDYDKLFAGTLPCLTSFPKELLALIGSPKKKKWQDIFRSRFGYFYNNFTRDGEPEKGVFISSATIDKEVDLFLNKVREASRYELEQIKMRNFPVREPVVIMLNFCKGCYYLYTAPKLEDVLKSTNSCSQKLAYLSIKESNGTFDRLKGLERDLRRYTEYKANPGFTITSASQQSTE